MMEIKTDQGEFRHLGSAKAHLFVVYHKCMFVLLVESLTKCYTHFMKRNCTLWPLEHIEDSYLLSAHPRAGESCFFEFGRAMRSFDRTLRKCLSLCKREDYKE